MPKHKPERKKRNLLQTIHNKTIMLSTTWLDALTYKTRHKMYLICFTDAGV